MTDQTNLNIPVLSVDETVIRLASAYSSVLDSGLSPSILPSVMLWGAPGIGKSQAVRQMGDMIGERTGKRVHITDVRLLLFNPIDLRGIPTANADKTLAIWLKPQIFQMEEGEDTVNILFLDELSAAPQSVQAAAYQITLDRVVGEHRLPSNCIVIAAGNRVTDRSVAFKMPKALANRLLHIEVEGSVSSWLKWAAAHGINDKVHAYIAARPDKLFGFEPDRDELAFPTPRSWEMVSNILNHVEADPARVGPLISGLIGSGAALEFKSWCRIYAELPLVTDIFAGKAAVVPKDTDRLYATVCSMIAYAGEHSADTDAIGKSLAYAAGLPADFIRMLLQGYAVMKKGYHKVLAGIPEYAALARRMGEKRNGRA